MKLSQSSVVLMAVMTAVLLAEFALAQSRPDKLRIGYAARAVAHSVPYVAKEAGFFSEEGIDAEIVRTAGSIAPMALVANEVDLAIMSAYLMIPVANFMVDLTDLKLEYQGSTVATRRTFVQKNPQLATRALRAIIRGVHLFKTRREDTMRILGKFLGTNDREALQESWDYAAKMPAKPYAVESAVQAVLDHLSESQPRFAQYRPGEFIDSRLRGELDKSGYIDRLYGQAQ